MKIKPSALADLLIAPQFFEFMQKFELLHDAQDSWLCGPQPSSFFGAITDQATWITASNSNQNAFNSKIKTEAFLLKSERCRYSTHLTKLIGFLHDHVSIHYLYFS
jgi:hypothetical protein